MGDILLGEKKTDQEGFSFACRGIAKARMIDIRSNF